MPPNESRGTVIYPKKFSSANPTTPFQASYRERGALMIPNDESSPTGAAPQPAGDYEADNEGASQTVPPPQPRKPRTLQNVVLLLVLIAFGLLAAYFYAHK